MIEKLIEAIKKNKNIVFFSGAGMSTDSGIPDFRSNSGLYKNNLRAEEILSHTFFMNNPEEFYTFYKEKMIFKDALPNYGHKFIANLENSKNITVVTQNIDGLHQMAGSKNVLELHGSILRNHCMKCHKFYSLEDVLNADGVPYCDCKGIIKPDVVLYEEALDSKVLSDSIDAISKAGLMVILGTSLNVYPAASLIRYFRGNTLAIINKDSTKSDSYCDIVIHNSISETFKKINL